MAEYITADRWLTGVATHKTRRGRILCTGIGCIGCFPQDYPELACELEVYDSKTALVFGESWNDLSNEEPIETGCDQRAPKPTKRKRKTRKKKTEWGKEERLENEPLFDEDKKNDTINIDTIETGQNGEVEKLFLTEYIHETEARSESEISQTDDNYKGSTAVEPCEECSVRELKDPLTNRYPSSILLADEVDEVIVDREDCVCLFFALEYNRSARMLPDLGILEIVSSLNTLMNINEIKCVQRLNGLWHIVLRTRQHLGYLLTNGVTIRGRWYQMVQDNDMYCDKVY